MNMFARFNENPPMTLQDIKETKCYGRTDGRTDNVKTVYPLQTKFAGGIMTSLSKHFPRTIKTVNYCLIYHTFLALTLRRGVLE